MERYTILTSIPCVFSFWVRLKLLFTGYADVVTLTWVTSADGRMIPSDQQIEMVPRWKWAQRRPISEIVEIVDRDLTESN